MKYSEEQQRQNIEKVKGTMVKVRRDPESQYSGRVAEIVGYRPPLVWELDREIYGTRFHHDRNVRTLDGQRIESLID